MDNGMKAVLAVVVVYLVLAVVLEVRELMWRHRRSKLDERYGWLKGYKRDGED